VPGAALLDGCGSTMRRLRLASHLLHVAVRREREGLGYHSASSGLAVDQQRSGRTGRLGGGAAGVRR
jgi:hypothetical protein